MTSFSNKITISSRFKEIVSILAKHGIADWLNNSDNDWIKKRLKNSKTKDATEQSTPVRIRLAILELGTTFIKFGQILSTRSDVIGAELALELSKLQSSTPFDDIDIVRNKIEEQLGLESIEEIFSEFSATPIASASIAQVHKAKLISGEDVVVKIMHNNIEDKIIEDLNILAKLAVLAERHGGFVKYTQPVLLVRQFSATMLDELNFNKELKNIERFAKNFRNDKRVTFPKTYPEQSSKSVLTMSFLTGLPLSKVEELNWTQEHSTKFSEDSASVFMDMMFRDKFYHADPHPGNLLIQQDGALGVIDCGMINKIDSKSNKLFEEIIVGVAQKDAEHIKNTILEICTLPKDVNTEVITYQIEEFVEEFLNLPLNEFDLSSAIKDITSIVEEHHISIPPNISNLARVIMMLEGSSRLLNPNFNIAVLFKKYHIKILKKRLAPRSILEKLGKNIHQWEQVSNLLPTVLNKVLKSAGSDKFEINLKHKNLENSVNKIVMALISSAMFLGSSLLWSFKVPPIFYGYSVFGILGVIISSYLAYKLIRDVNRSDKS